MLIPSTDKQMLPLLTSPAKVDEIVDRRSVAGVEMPTDLDETRPPSIAPNCEEQNILFRGRILVAEDGRDNQRLLSTHLRACGADVVIAENGQIVVDLVVKNSFDLILMDMQMPVMDGYAAAAELRRRKCVTAIIALTAHAKAEDREKCMVSGCTDYLRKPIDLDTLLKMVNKYLRNASTQAPPIKSSGTPQMSEE
jgi:CheY-like chemotaxis protein